MSASRFLLRYLVLLLAVSALWSFRQQRSLGFRTNEDQFLVKRLPESLDSTADKRIEESYSAFFGNPLIYHNCKKGQQMDSKLFWGQKAFFYTSWKMWKGHIWHVTRPFFNVFCQTDGGLKNQVTSYLGTNSW